MDDTALIKALWEVSHKLGAVIGEQVLRLYGQQVDERIQGDGGIAAGSGIGCKGDGEAAVGVDTGFYAVSFDTPRAKACASELVASAKTTPAQQGAYCFWFRFFSNPMIRRQPGQKNVGQLGAFASGLTNRLLALCAEWFRLTPAPSILPRLPARSQSPPPCRLPRITHPSGARYIP